jgi:hypothetical protein
MFKESLSGLFVGLRSGLCHGNTDVLAFIGSVCDRQFAEIAATGKV